MQTIELNDTIQSTIKTKVNYEFLSIKNTLYSAVKKTIITEKTENGKQLATNIKEIEYITLTKNTLKKDVKLIYQTHQHDFFYDEKNLSRRIFPFLINKEKLDISKIKEQFQGEESYSIYDYLQNIDKDCHEKKPFTALKENPELSLFFSDFGYSHSFLKAEEEKFSLFLRIRTIDRFNNYYVKDLASFKEKLKEQPYIITEDIIKTVPYYNSSPTNREYIPTVILTGDKNLLDLVDKYEIDQLVAMVDKDNTTDIQHKEKLEQEERDKDDCTCY